MKKSQTVIITVLISMLGLQAGAESVSRDASTLFESNRKAQLALQNAIKKYGGPEQINQIKVDIELRSSLISEGQSLSSEPPFETYPFSLRMKIDPATSRFYSDASSAIAGDFNFSNRMYIQNGKGFAINPSLKNFEEMSSEPSYLDRFLPFKMLIQASQNPPSLRLVTESPDEIQISYATANGQLQTMTLMNASNLLQRIESIGVGGVYGDGSLQIEYSDYKQVNGVPFAYEIRTRSRNQVIGLTENVYRVDRVSTSPEFTASESEIPQGYLKADTSWRPDFTMTQLGKDVYLAQNITSTKGQWSYNSLVVLFDDFVLVAEAPVNSPASEKVLAKIKELAPGKPVRYLVQSHHHNDHVGGIRSYIAERATIITTSVAAPLIRKIAAASFSLSPDRLFNLPVDPMIEVVDREKTIADSNHKVVIYDVGPNPHAKQMLIVYLPDQKVLYQSDLVNRGEYPPNASTASFLEKLKELKLEVQTIAGLHGRILKGTEVTNLIQQK